MAIRFIFLLFVFSSAISVFPQEKKTLNIVKTKVAPKIDGVLDDEVWQNAEEAKDFIQFRPDMGLQEKEHQKTIVKVSYNDDAIFFGAHLHDNPEEITRQFTSRDNFGQSDFFGVVINSNNDAQNDLEFFVFSSGTQADALASPDIGEDFGWNAVWDSAVRIVDDGWIVEMKIPYSALRFTNQENPTWGLQFHRHFRADRSQFTWNPIDLTIGYHGLYHGELKGLKNIEPPTRLSFYPFTSALVSSFDGETVNEYRLGLDIKYGLSDNFTLDATLIPDFSQAGFDNRTLNLGPFEQTFSEQRQFFKEGVDLFNKGNLFFSRRVGNAPAEPDLDDDDEFVNFPNRVKLLNAVKISGRTKNGLGIGFFNAITEKTEASIKNNVTDETRKEIVEPLANYNIFVIDKQFNKNSSVSLINTNVTRSGHFRDANVTAALFNLTNKANTYNISGQAKLSNVNELGEHISGFSSRFSVGKVSGNYQYNIGHRLADTKYDINDLGLQLRNNFNNIFFNASYRIFEPTEKLNNLNINFSGSINRLYKPSVYTGNDVNIDFFALTKNIFAFGANLFSLIGKQRDYFGPRTERRYSEFKNWLSGNAWISTDYNKTFALDARIGFGTLVDKKRDLFNYRIRVSPRFKLNDNFIFSLSTNYDNNKGNRGYVTDIDEDIIYGQRDQKMLENSISGSYNFNSFHGLTLTFRNFWTTVNYEHDLFLLEENGSFNSQAGFNLDNIDDDPNINFNTWNLDLKYAWEFAPGSQLIALYRNQLFNQDNASQDNYFESLSTLFDQPIEHVFSLRFVYYIDYNNVKNIFSKKTN